MCSGVSVHRRILRHPATPIVVVGKHFTVFFAITTPTPPPHLRRVAFFFFYSFKEKNIFTEFRVIIFYDTRAELYNNDNNSSRSIISDGRK